ncbi:hypothetical protein TcasGA2_TC003762 [Tribolium castaneum]|uniref:Uncharacterized protein n=1 Tax=Tribolium castaneum TaxID=7070 RepID=D6WEB9_TRICA|nr:hypothetical protein TcasGA2_TC003762 [Tribolium castaneum]
MGLRNAMRTAILGHAVNYHFVAFGNRKTENVAENEKMRPECTSFYDGALKACSLLCMIGVEIQIGFKQTMPSIPGVRAMCQSSGNLYLVSGTSGMRESFSDGVDPAFSWDSASRV